MLLIEYCFLGLWNCVYLIQQFACKAHRDVCLMRHIRMNLLLLNTATSACAYLPIVPLLSA